MNEISKKSMKDSLQIGLDMVTTDKKKLKENLDHLYYYNGSCYYLSRRNIMKTFSLSNEFCKNIGTNNFSRLYEFKNLNEYEYLVNRTKKVFDKIPEKYVSYYIGMNTKADKGIHWSSGRDLTKFEEQIVFFNQTPVSYPHTNCFAMNIQGDPAVYSIMPTHCGAPNGFICKFGK